MPILLLNSRQISFSNNFLLGCSVFPTFPTFLCQDLRTKTRFLRKIVGLEERD
jgi:hypothetical protein